MAGTVTVLDSYERKEDANVLKRTQVDWISDGGSADGSVEVHGTILKVQFIPSAVDAPTDNYDVTLTDLAGADVLRGQGADLDTATVKTFIPLVDATDGTNNLQFPCVVDEELVVAVRNAGNAKQGSIVIYYR
jgi:hypothetical protein